MRGDRLYYCTCTICGKKFRGIFGVNYCSSKCVIKSGDLDKLLDNRKEYDNVTDKMIKRRAELVKKGKDWREDTTWLNLFAREDALNNCGTLLKKRMNIYMIDPCTGMYCQRSCTGLAYTSGLSPNCPKDAQRLKKKDDSMDFLANNNRKIEGLYLDIIRIIEKWEVHDVRFDKRNEAVTW